MQAEPHPASVTTASIEAVRTPRSRFAKLRDFPWTPRYVDELTGFEGLRLAWLDEVAHESDDPDDVDHVFLCLHGEPTWSYLYRKMIPHFLGAGGRVVAPDWFGFGRSDKPVDDEVYTFDFHRRSLQRFIEHLDLKRITLVCQDWGGILGLTMPMEMPERFERLIVMNTALPTGETPPTAGFVAWKSFVASQPDMDVGKLMKRAVPGLTDAEAAAYEAPFPDATFKAGVRTFPEIVPIAPNDAGADICRRAANWLSSEWDGESFMAVGVQDPVLGPKVMAKLRETIRGCPEPLMLQEAGHFVQEAGEIVAREALEFFG